jgi:SAM-dependent methyltransferase
VPHTSWFEEWFGDDYLELYPHRDDAEAEKAVELIARNADGAGIKRVLDLACGAGRHTRALHDRGWWTTGLDLSHTLLKVAHREDPTITYARGDMRALPYRDYSFDLIVNLFTSFGYFDTDAQHLRVLAEVARAVRKGGTFVMDFLNANQVRNTLVQYDEKRIGDKIIEQHRSISKDGRYVEKSIILQCDGRKFIERVRLFDSDELEMMIEEAGFDITHRFGDYSGTPLNSTSPRTILFGVRG